MNMGERIKQLRIENGLTQEELGKYIGVQKSAIRKYEKGEVKNMKRSSIQILSNLFKVSPSYLMCIDEEDEIKTNNNTITTSIPLLSDFKNDLETSITNFLIKYISVNESFSDNTYALKINDNSMLPLLGIGDIAIIATNFNYESGQTCLVLNNDIYMIRKIISKENGFELQAMNPYYPIENTKELKIIGRIIKAENRSAFK